MKLIVLFVGILALAGCASAHSTLALGPSIVSSRDLGYVQNYGGVRAEATTTRDRMILRTNLGAFDSAKVETGDGWGLRAGVVAGYQVTRHLSLLAGAEYRRQTTSTWTKEGIAPRIEAELAGKYLLARIGGEWLDEPDDRQRNAFVEVRSLQRVAPLFVRYERVEYRTLFAEGTGERYELGLLFTVGSKGRRRGRRPAQRGGGSAVTARGSGRLVPGSLPLGWLEGADKFGEHLSQQNESSSL